MKIQNGKRLSRGDIVEIEWLDKHPTDRLTHLEIEDLVSPIHNAFSCDIDNREMICDPDSSDVVISRHK